MKTIEETKKEQREKTQAKFARELRVRRAGKLKLIHAMLRKGMTHDGLLNCLADAWNDIEELQEDNRAVMKLFAETQSALAVFTETQGGSKFRKGVLELLAEDGERLTAIKLLKGINTAASIAGKEGATKKHAPMTELRDWAIKEYKAGNWPSANRAAHALEKKVVEHGRLIKAILSEENAQRTIAEWIRKAKKSV